MCVQSRKGRLGFLYRKYIRLAISAAVLGCLTARLGHAGQEISEIPGSAGYALDFDGNEFAQSDHPALNLTDTNQFTLEAWVYRRPEGAYWQVVLGKQYTNPYGLTVTEDRFLHFELHTSSGRRLLDTPAGSVPFNTWTHIAGTWDGSVVRAYVNGVERGFAPWGGTIQTITDPFLIGAVHTGASDAWRGMIDEVRIWNLARSASEILDASTIPLNGNEAGLVAYWQFDEGSGQSAYAAPPSGILLQLGESLSPDDHDPEWVESNIPLFAVSLGRVAFDSEAYSCIDNAGIELLDRDLLGNATQTVSVRSSGLDSETPVLAETEPGLFRGSIPIEEGFVLVGDGVIQVADGEVITARYEDADDGTGHPRVVTDTALIDCEPPRISEVSVIQVGGQLALVGFHTDETSFGTIYHGTDCGDLPNMASSETPDSTHEIALSHLEPESQYFFAVEATDLARNTIVDDNGGECYSFTTAHKQNFYLGFDWSSFEGDRAVSEYHPALDVRETNQFTLEALVYRRPFSSYWHIAVGMSERSPFALSVSGDGELRVDLRTEYGAIQLDTPKAAVPLEAWTHIAGTFDSSTLRAYVNGIEFASRTVWGPIGPPASGILIGGGLYYPWEGFIDEVRVWNLARSEKEVRESMYAPLEGDEPGLVAYWRLNEGFGQWAYDETSNDIRLRLGSTPDEDEHDPEWVLWLASIEPAQPTTIDDLRTVLDGSICDNGQGCQVTYMWFRNGRLILEPVEVAGNTFFATEAALSHHFTAKNETHFCLVDIVDGTTEIEGQTPPVLILNTPPTAPVVNIIPENPISSDGLTALVTQFSSDIDGDELGYAIRWYLSRDGGQTFEWIPILNWITVPPGYLADGDIWRVEIIPFELDEPEIEGEVGWDQVYVGANNRPVVAITRPGSQNAMALSTVIIAWQAEDIDGDAVTVDLYYDTDAIEGGAFPIVMDQPETGSMTWQPPGADASFASADLSGDGLVDADDLFILASRWYDVPEKARYRIFARAWDEKGAIGEAFSPGEVIVPEGFPTNTEGLLRALREWSQE